MKHNLITILLICGLLVVSCNTPAYNEDPLLQELGSTKEKQTSVKGILEESQNPERKQFVWIATSKNVFYDMGGSETLPAGDVLELLPDQTWSLNKQNGKWEIAVIEQTDWKRWALIDFSTQLKIVLHGWNGETGDGPIQKTGEIITTMWLVYRTGPPEIKTAGQVQIKFEAE